MKKIISIAIALVFVYESWIKPEYQSVGGQFKIIEKKGDWILVQSESGEKYKVHIKSEDLWLVLEVNKKYSIVFSRKGNGEYYLEKVIHVPKQEP